MSKATFSIVAILPGRTNDYFDFWKRDIKVNAAGESLHSAMLALTDTFDAKNKAEAESMARKKYPGHTIDSAATQRHG